MVWFDNLFQAEYQRYFLKYFSSWYAVVTLVIIKKKLWFFRSSEKNFKKVFFKYIKTGNRLLYNREAAYVQCTCLSYFRGKEETLNRPSSQTQSTKQLISCTLEKSVWHLYFKEWMKTQFFTFYLIFVSHTVQ